MLLFAGASSIVGVAIAGFFVEKEFFPSAEESRFQVTLQTPVDYSVEQADRLGGRVEDVLRTFPEVTTILYDQGGGATGEINKVSMIVNLKPKTERLKRQNQIKTEIRTNLRQIPGLRYSVDDIALLSSWERQSMINYTIRGLPALERYAGDMASEFAKYPGIAIGRKSASRSTRIRHGAGDTMISASLDSLRLQKRT